MSVKNNMTMQAGNKVYATISAYHTDNWEFM